ncbi:MAG: hypothetical protein JNL67_07485 [Planctomycetaceae bacterium]|nr:hypothetical protein [Planctomycetaceae bacterium]
MDRPNRTLRSILAETDPQTISGMVRTMCYPGNSLDQLTADLLRSRLAVVRFIKLDDGSPGYEMTWRQADRTIRHCGPVHAASNQASDKSNSHDLVLGQWPTCLKPLSLLCGNLITDARLEYEVELAAIDPLQPPSPASDLSDLWGEHVTAANWTLSASSDDDIPLIGFDNRDQWDVNWNAADFLLTLRSHRSLPSRLPVLIHVEFEDENGDIKRFDPPIFGQLELSSAATAEPTWVLGIESQVPIRPTLPNGVQLPVKLYLRNVGAEEVVDLPGDAQFVPNAVSSFLSASDYDVFVGHLNSRKAIFRNATSVSLKENANSILVRWVDEPEAKKDPTPFDLAGSPGDEFSNFSERATRMWPILHDDFLVRQVSNASLPGFDSGVDRDKPRDKRDKVEYLLGVAHFKMCKILDKLEQIEADAIREGKSGIQAVRKYFSTVMENERKEFVRIASGKTKREFYPDKGSSGTGSSDQDKSTAASKTTKPMVLFQNSLAFDETDDNPNLDPISHQNHETTLADEATWTAANQLVNEFCDLQKEMNAEPVNLEAWKLKSRLRSQESIRKLSDEKLASKLNTQFGLKLTSDQINDRVHAMDRRWAVFLVGKKLSEAGVMTEADWAVWKSRIAGGKRGMKHADQRIDLLIATTCLFSNQAIDALELDFIESWLLRDHGAEQLCREFDILPASLPEWCQRLGRTVHAQIICDGDKSIRAKSPLDQHARELLECWLIENNELDTAISKVRSKCDENRREAEKRSSTDHRKRQTKLFNPGKCVDEIAKVWNQSESIVPPEYRQLPEESELVRIGPKSNCPGRR